MNLRKAPPQVLLLLAGLVILSTARSLGNGFALDDVPIILENVQVHAVEPPWVYAQQSYWPPANLGPAYRPWTIWMFALQWRSGGGAPWLFHLVNVVLTLGVTFAVYQLARAMLSPVAAIAAAALFSVHPVHVEATGNVVGQAELWMALFVLISCLIYLRAREHGTPTALQRWSIAGLLVLAAAAKEQGIVLPALLVVLEWWVVKGPGGWQRIRTIAPTFVLLGIVGVAFLVARYLVLNDAGGGPAIAGLDQLSIVQRGLVMLPVVLEWLRLFVWPDHLEAQYSPPAYGGPPTWSPAAIGGLIAFALLIILAIAVRRRAPVITMGLAWTGLALLPVANIVFATGIVLAERTLFLPSVGIVLAGTAAAVWITNRHPQTSLPLGTALLLLLALGAARSFSRQAVWQSNDTIFPQTIVDGPRSYRGFQVFGMSLARQGHLEEAAAVFGRAASLYQGDHRVFEDLGQALRAQDRCDQAIAPLRQGLSLHPTEIVLRSRLFECLLTLGRPEEALAVAEEGIAHRMDEFEKSAERARARIGR
ncbi:MAG: tetratricopeptide repeat protein [Gemmatimonadales bacterium]